MCKSGVNPCHALCHHVPKHLASEQGRSETSCEYAYVSPARKHEGKHSKTWYELSTRRRAVEDSEEGLLKLGVSPHQDKSDVLHTQKHHED